MDGFERGLQMQRRGRSHLRSTGPVVVLVGLLVVVDLAAHLGPEHASLVLSAPFAATVLLVARWGGLSWQSLGLTRASCRAGACWALVAVLAVAVLYAVALSVPALRPRLLDPRDELGVRAALLTALVLIPVRTVVPEELAFRGVLWALVARDHGTRAATAVSSSLFGLWHLPPALGVGRSGRTLDVAAALSARWPLALGTVAFTGLAGVLFCELRRRSGSLLAPVGLHWATNGLGVLASAAAWSLTGTDAPADA